MHDTPNDLQLLRPITIALLTPGVLLTSPNQPDGKAIWAYTAGPDVDGRIVATILEGRTKGQFASASHFSAFRFAPLGWVEGRPVYPGDELFITEDEPVHTDLKRGCAVVAIGITEEWNFILKDSGYFMPPKFLTWTKPQPKLVHPPAPWADWHGGERPFRKGVLVDVKHRDGSVYYCQQAGVPGSMAHDWTHGDGLASTHPGDIVKYRLSVTQ